jgi:hypothetical protein
MLSPKNTAAPTGQNTGAVTARHADDGSDPGTAHLGGGRHMRGNDTELATMNTATNTCPIAKPATPATSTHAAIASTWGPAQPTGRTAHASNGIGIRHV